MNKELQIKNFLMGEELDICGSLLYDLRKHYRDAFKNKSNSEAFRFFYNLTVALERLFKILIVLENGELEKKNRDINIDGDAHHSLGMLSSKVEKFVKLGFHKQTRTLLGYLYSEKYYDTYRYYNFNFSPRDSNQIVLNIHYDNLKIMTARVFGVNFSNNMFTPDIAVFNESDLAKKFDLVIKDIAQTFFSAIKIYSNKLNIFIHEFATTEKSSWVFNDCSWMQIKQNLSPEYVKTELLLFLLHAARKHVADKKPCNIFDAMLSTWQPLNLEEAYAPDYFDILVKNNDVGDLINQIEFELFENGNIKENKIRVKEINNVVKKSQNFIFDIEDIS